jgi:hypothetical protein
MTPLQIREKLVELVSHHISKAKVGELKELLKIKGTPNGGIAVTDDLKYNSKCPPRCTSSQNSTLIRLLQSSIPVQTVSMSLPQLFGTA